MPWNVASQAPKTTPPSKGDAKGHQEAKDQAQTVQPITIDVPSSINVVVTGKLQVEGKTEQPEKHKQALESPEFYVAAFTGMLVGVTFLLMRYTKKLWSSTKDLVEKTEATTKTIDRAYVKISHKKPGVQDYSGVFSVGFEVRNFGHTPAVVTAAYMTARTFANDGGEFPPPDYSRQNNITDGPHAFLVRDEFVTIYPNGFTTDDWEAIQEGTRRLIVYGYVDYIDSFGVHHRGGYGREYLAMLDDEGRYSNTEAFENRSNLRYLPTSGYNYDRERKEGEGNDW